MCDDKHTAEGLSVFICVTMVTHMSDHLYFMIKILNIATQKANLILCLTVWNRWLKD